MQIGDILKHLRANRSLTQEDLAAELGISASYLSLLEAGKRPATKRVLRSLAGYLDVPAGYFVLHEMKLTELAPRHRSIVKEARRELVEPAFARVFGKARRTAPAPAAPPPEPAPTEEHAGRPEP